MAEAKRQNLSFDEIKDRHEYGFILSRAAHGAQKPSDKAELARIVKSVGIDAVTLAQDAAHFARLADAHNSGDQAKVKDIWDAGPRHLRDWQRLPQRKS